MYLSLDWLKDFVKIPKSFSPEELGLKLTMHTVEIDSVEKQADKFADIVVGKILEIKKHPDADRLQLSKVDVGKEKLGIVCGAPNIKVGQKVPVALVGAKLPNGMEIKEAEVRGEKSCGMLCAEDELGMGDDHSGIMILEKGAKIGQNLGQYFNLKDVIFEVDNKSITHRPDLWSHYGIAREISAFLGVKLKGYNVNAVNTNNANVKFGVKVEDYELCPRYMAVAMDGIKIEPSPKWMQERLIAVGMRPINNIVDITNYVMLELGQPLHAFDASLINRESNANNRECKIIVRRAKENELIETLDGEKRKLDKEILVIANENNPIAIAGVMGGENSEINNGTDSIIIESANFDFISIRKTSQKLGLRTESSIRFEKAIDPNLCEMAINRTVELVKKLCPKAKVASKMADEKKFKLDQGPIELDLNLLNKRIGTSFAKAMEGKAVKIVKILESLGFNVEKDESKLKVITPTWRATRDISIPEDLVEEVARIYGYDNLIPNMPRVAMEAPIINQERILERKIKTILSGSAALTEVYNYSFVGQEQLEKLGIDFSSHVKLANPIASHQTMLRQSLVPNLVENIKANQAKFNTISLFEIGSICLGIEGELQKNNKSKERLPYQEKRLSIIVAGSGKENVFSKVKGIVDCLLLSLDLAGDFTPIGIKPNWADKNASANINAEDRNIGLIAKLDSKIINGLGVKKEAAVAEISLREILNLINVKGAKKYQEFAKFPPLIRDLAFVVNEEILYNDIRDEIVNFNDLIKSVELFDVYQGGALGINKKNLAFHIIYQSNKTLTADEIDVLQKKLIKRLEEKFEAKIRDF